MWPRTVMLLWVTIFPCTYRQCVADGAQCSTDAANTYVAELMVESKVTVNISAVVASIAAVTVNDPPVTICSAELISECEIIGDKTTCNCCEGYTWSNTVCDSHTCCNESSCNENVSDISPLCIPKVRVRLNGSVTSWQSSYKATLTDEFRTLNGFESLNVTGLRDGGTIADFEVGLSVIFQSTVLQDKISTLENDLSVTIKVASIGLVTMQAPNSTVCYESTQSLSCTFKEASENASWTLTKETETFELVTGSVAEVLSTCRAQEFPSCTKVTISKVTGTYECKFTNGSISHTASTVMDVALLPESINMTIDPLTVDCSDGTSQKVVITSSIQNSRENYTDSWYHEGMKMTKTSHQETEEQLIYNLEATLNCEPGPHFARITFTNRKSDKKSARIDIPVVHAYSKVCQAEDIWPKTPVGYTLLIRECDLGRVGYLERTCLRTDTWLPVLSNCVKEELNRINNAAADFQEGLGATQEVALKIFSGLKNISSDTTNDQADLSISIHILNIMSTASEKITLDESVVPDFLGAASNMLNTTWDPVNSSVEQSLSSTFLTSMEDLVKNIRMNSSDVFNTANVELKMCHHQNKSSCNRTVFGVGVNLDQSSSGSVKAMGLKNLSEKLKHYKEDETPNIVVSVTLDRRRNSTAHPKINLTLNFPMSRSMSTDDKVFCVFWNTTNEQWSQDGCSWAPGETKNQSICRCNHLTSFSALMSTHPVDLPFITEITNAALGVSICSLLVFLVIEALVWSAVVKSNLSHFRHTAMVNISLCLFLADCSFLASSFPEILSEPWCLILTLSKHYFFLAMFFWMLCLSSMLVHQLIFVFSPLRKRVYMFLSSILGYVFPTVIVGVTYLYYKSKELSYHTEFCWLTYEGLMKGSIHAFILPVGVIVLMNLFSMVVVILTLLKSSVPEASKADDKEMAKSILKVVIFLTPVFGVTWALGFVTLQLRADSGPMAMVVHYVYTIFNALQGFFVLLTGCLAEQKVREELYKLMSGVPKQKRKSESMKNLTTSSKN